MQQEDKAPLFEGAAHTSAVLMLLTALSIPFMLFPKPIILYYQNKKKEQQGDHVLLVDGESGHGHGEKFEFGEIVIHQVIETIEYVLGTVSHTASYLRQWALSLAHQQLALVFFQKTILAGLRISFPFNVIAIFISFAVWFVITLAIL